jgi:hypothetical protein
VTWTDTISRLRVSDRRHYNMTHDFLKLVSRKKEPWRRGHHEGINGQAKKGSNFWLLELSE